MRRGLLRRPCRERYGKDIGQRQINQAKVEGDCYDTFIQKDIYKVMIITSSNSYRNLSKTIHIKTIPLNGKLNQVILSIPALTVRIL